MKLRTKLANYLSNAWDRAVHPHNIYSRIYEKSMTTPVPEHRYVGVGNTQDGTRLYARQQLVLPYANRVWAVAAPAKGEKDKFTVTRFEQNLNTGAYDYSMNEKIRSRPVALQSGRSIFTRDEAIDVIHQVEKMWSDAGYYQTCRQPPAEKLAANIAAPKPAPN